MGNLFFSNRAPHMKSNGNAINLSQSAAVNSWVIPRIASQPEGRGISSPTGAGFHSENLGQTSLDELKRFKALGNGIKLAHP